MLNVDIDYFKCIDSYEKAYWLGFIAADGHITKDGGKLTFAIRDEEILPKFKKAIKSEHKISHSLIYDKRTNKKYERYTLQVTNKNFVQHIINYGIDNSKTMKFKFPNIAEEFYKDFIAGMFDGDGCVGTCRNRQWTNLRLSLISTLEGLFSIQEFLSKEINIGKTKLQVVAKDKNVYKLHIYKYRDIIKIIDYIYTRESSIYLQRKYIKAQSVKLLFANKRTR